MNVGPSFTDPLARQIYAEIASIEEQHVTQYESIIDAQENWLEKWLLHEATEVYNYYSCLEYESNSRIKSIWERFLEYELGHFRLVADLFEKIEKRDVAEVLQESLPDPIRYESHRQFVRDVLRNEVHLSAIGPDFVDRHNETEQTRAYRDHLNSQGSPTDTVAAGYVWMPGTELVDPAKFRKQPPQQPSQSAEIRSNV